MAFCYQNCSDLLWEKIVQVDWEKLLKFEDEGWEFSKFFRSLEQFIWTMKGQNSFGWQNAFLTWVFSGLINQNNYNSNYWDLETCRKSRKTNFIRTSAIYFLCWRICTLFFWIKYRLYHVLNVNLFWWVSFYSCLFL